MTRRAASYTLRQALGFTGVVALYSAIASKLTSGADVLVLAWFLSVALLARRPGVALGVAFFLLLLWLLMMKRI